MRRFFEDREYELKCCNCVYWRKDRSSNIFVYDRNQEDAEGTCTRGTRGKRTYGYESCPEGES